MDSEVGNDYSCRPLAIQPRMFVLGVCLLRQRSTFGEV